MIHIEKITLFSSSTTLLLWLRSLTTQLPHPLKLLKPNELKHHPTRLTCPAWGGISPSDNSMHAPGGTAGITNASSSTLLSAHEGTSSSIANEANAASTMITDQQLPP